MQPVGEIIISMFDWDPEGKDDAVCVHACIHVCMYAYVTMRYMYVCVYVLMFDRNPEGKDAAVCVHVCVCVCMYVCIFVFMYAL